MHPLLIHVRGGGHRCTHWFMCEGGAIGASTPQAPVQARQVESEFPTLTHTVFEYYLALASRPGGAHT